MGCGLPLGEIGALPLFVIGDVSFPLSMEALGHAVGEDNNSPFTLDARRRWCGVRAGSMPENILYLVKNRYLMRVHDIPCFFIKDLYTLFSLGGKQ